ncbi:MAG TPA: hypothetical protein VIO13_08210 [Candidatus Dormibacteraeota bacterium]|jgi:hypothetical protein
MDPIEIREERVTTGPGVSPEEGVAPPGSTAGGTPPPMAPVSTPPPVAPPSAAPVATTTGVYSSRVSVTPMASRTSQAVWLIAGVIDIVLAMEFIFRAAGANNTGFAHYVYRVGEKLSAPFDGIFNTTVRNGTSVFRWADVLAVAVYSILAWIIVKVVRITTTPRTGANSV